MSLCVNKILQKYHNFILRRIDWHFLYLSALKNFQHAMNRRVAFVTLGCKVNFAESSTLARRFAEAGFERVPQEESADVYVINSCSVTEHADKKCRNIVRRLHRQNPDAIVAVTGCYAQLKPDAIAAIEGVDLVFGNNFKDDIPSMVSELSDRGRGRIISCGTGELTAFFSAFSHGDRTRSFLKVQDGCDYKCAYCTIHYARGGSRNIPIAEVVRQAEEIARRGVREIVITGINTGDFGRSTGENFYDLIRALDGVQGIERYRISSIEPNLLTDEIIDFCAASEKFQPHFHIPLQSGCDTILHAMRRRYTTGIYARRIERIRSVMPDAFIGVDVITGFPGEGEAEAAATYDFLAHLAPSFLHVFPFSERPGTPAAEMTGKVPAAISAQRAKRLEELSDSLHRDFCSRYAGQEAKVLFENSGKNGMMHGFTGNYIRVVAPYRKELTGKISAVTLDKWSETDKSMTVVER